MTRMRGVRHWRDRVVRYLFGRDFFISYSRRDAAPYAAALARRLSEHYSCYLDQLATPRGEALPVPIQRELQRASAFVLVGTTGAVHSTYVADELRLFLAVGRPVLIVDVGGQLEPAPWSEQPWSQLIGVFRQSEVPAALEQAAPSDALVSYLSDSFAFTRQDRRLRRASRAAAALLLTVFAVAAIVSVVTTRWANQAAAEAAAQGRIATSRRLAGESSTALRRDPSLAIQLAANAFTVAPTGDAWRAMLDGLTRYPGLLRVLSERAAPEGILVAGPQGQWWIEAVRRSIVVREAQSLKVVARLDQPDENLFGFAASANGERLAVGRHDYVGIWDWRSNRELGRVPATTPGALAFVGDTALVIASGNVLEWWDVSAPDHAQRHERNVLQDEVRALASEGGAGKALAVATAKDVFVCVWPNCEKERQTLTRAGDSKFDALAMATGEHGSYIAALNSFTGRLVIFSDLRGRIVDLLVPLAIASGGNFAPTGYETFTMAISPDGQLVAIASTIGRLLLASLEQIEGLAALQRPDADPAVRDAVRMTMQVEQPFIRQLDYPPGALKLAFTLNGSRLLMTQGDYALSEWDIENRLPIERVWPWPSGYEAGSRHALSADGRYVLLTEENGSVRLADIAGGGQQVAMASLFSARPGLIAISSDGMFVAALEAGDYQTKKPRTLAIWDRTGRLRATYPVDVAAPGRQFSRYPTHLIVEGVTEGPLLVLNFDDGGVLVLDASVSMPRVVRQDSLQARTIALSPSGAQLAIAGSKGGVGIWNPRTGVRQSLSDSIEDVRTVVFSSDEKRLIVVTETNNVTSVVSWDVASRRQEPAWVVNTSDTAKGTSNTGDVMQPTAFAVASTGQLLALASNRTVAVWDLDSHVLLATLTVPPGLDLLAFSRDGSQLLASHDNGISRVDIAGSQLLTRICEIASRPLTSGEMQLYFGDARPPLECGR